MPITRTYFVAPLPEGAINIKFVGTPALETDKKGGNYFSVPFRAEKDTAQTVRQRLLFSDKDMDLLIKALQTVAPTTKLNFTDIVRHALNKYLTVWQHTVHGDKGTFYNWYYSEESYQKALVAKATVATTDEELAKIIGE